MSRIKSEIPFKKLKIDEEGYHLLLKIFINNKVAKVILDTGASKTVFDANRIDRFAKNAKLTNHDKLSTGLGTNTMQSQFTILKKIKIGDMLIKDYNAILLDLSHVNNSYSQIGLPEIDGVLGSDILMKYNAVIDYRKKTLRLIQLQQK